MKILFVSAGILCLAMPVAAQSIVEVPDWGTKLTKDWGGARQSLAEVGLIVEMNSTYTSQYVADGGVETTIFGEDIDDFGHTLSTEIDIKFDTHAAGLWPGGMLRFFAEARNGRSVQNRARAAVNYDASLPAVPRRGDDDVIAVNELSFTQFLSETIGVFGGLLDTAYGDVNDFAGDGRSNDYFLNLNFNANPVGIASTPDVALGGGLIYIPNKTYQGWAGVYNSEAAAGFDPFENDEGTTFFAEGSRRHVLAGKDGKQTLGILYGIDKDRIDVFADGRLALESLLVNNTLLATDKDTWAVYYSVQQYVEGDADKGWGVFLRAGISDGDPNPVENYFSVGIGGKGLFDSRPEDRFGIGGYRIGFSDDGLLAAINIDESYGFETFYSFSVIPGLRISPDIQVIHSPVPRVENPVIVGSIRIRLAF